jgi:hypothetical protein
MSQVEAMYQERLGELRQLAQEEGISFIDVLIRVTGAYEKIGLYSEEELIRTYRLHYYEIIANHGIEIKEAIKDWARNHNESMNQVVLAILAEKQKIVQARKINEAQKQNLSYGREKGSAINKQRADAVKAKVQQMNKDILAHPDSARWTLSRRARYIEAKIGSATIEIEGKSYKATMANGKKYAVSTIRTWITGN